MVMPLDKLQRPNKLFCLARARESARRGGRARAWRGNAALYRFTTLLVLKK